jgi:hypothetical protein
LGRKELLGASRSQVSALLKGDALLLRLQKLPAEVFALSVAMVRGRGWGWKKFPQLIGG